MISQDVPPSIAASLIYWRKKSPLHNQEVTVCSTVYLQFVIRDKNVIRNTPAAAVSSINYFIAFFLSH